MVAAEGDYTSLLWPFQVQGEVRTVPVDRLAEAAADADVLAFSAVQSATGEVADLDAIAEAAEAHGVMTIVDATQALGWLPMEVGRFDVVACAAYKWLMASRGAAFMSVRRSRLDAIEPVLAGWFAAEDVHSSYYGSDMQLAPTRAGSTRRRRGSAGCGGAGARADRARRGRAHPRARRRAREPVPRGPRAAARATRRSSPPRPRTSSASRPRGSSRRSAPGGCEPHGTPTTPRRTSTAYSTCWRRLRTGRADFGTFCTNNWNRRVSIG